jgi:hypothetical protein
MLKQVEDVEARHCGESPMIDVSGGRGETPGFFGVPHAMIMGRFHLAHEWCNRLMRALRNWNASLWMS